MINFDKSQPFIITDVNQENKDQIFDILHNLGFTWSSQESFKNNSEFPEWCTSLVYEIHNKGFQMGSDFVGIECERITADDFIYTHFKITHKIISLDFDGVIHNYSKGFHDGTIYDNPLSGVINFINYLMDDKKYSVFILTARDPNEVMIWIDKLYYYNIKTEVITNSKFWNKIGILGITNIKLPASIYIDDRALKFTGNFAETIIDIENFKTWQGQV